jgi:predicted TPR repeat methyltransferase
VLAAEPDNIDAWFHRGTALAVLERPQEALAAIERVLAMNAGLAEPWLRHGQLLERLGRTDAALASLDRALALAPALAPAWLHRGGILRSLGRLEPAAEAFAQAAAHGADPQLCAYYLAAVAGGPAPPASPAGYVRGLFDSYADDFDDHLVRVLGYQAPAVIARLLDEHAAGRRYRSALDLGCGTGLCGPMLRARSERLVGIDLSRPMLDKAAARGLYDELVCADIGAHLAGPGEQHDLVVATDVFIYVGDLAPVFESLARRVAAGGLFAFSAEQSATAAASGAAEPGFRLQPSLRYAHGEAYLRTLAERTGFEPLALHRDRLRSDQQEGVPALFVLLRRC